MYVARASWVHSFSAEGGKYSQHREVGKPDDDEDEGKAYNDDDDGSSDVNDFLKLNIRIREII